MNKKKSSIFTALMLYSTNLVHFLHFFQYRQKKLYGNIFMERVRLYGSVLIKKYNSDILYNFSNQR